MNHIRNVIFLKRMCNVRLLFAMIVEKNANRFDPYLSSKDRFGESRIMVRRHKGAIVEMVMLTNYRKAFSVINFTGIMSDEFISELARSMKQKRS